MVLGASKKTKDKELLLEAYPHTLVFLPPPWRLGPVAFWKIRWGPSAG